MATAPTVYILHGDDELAITRYIGELEGKLGDPGTVALNTTRMDGSTYSLNELIGVTAAMPFLAKRRLVVLENFSGRLKDKSEQEAFKAALENVPPSTALVLVERKPLVDEKERRKYNKEHWLEKWAGQAGSRALLKEFTTPRGYAFIRWIQEQAQAAGGEFTQEAAKDLAGLVNENPRQAEQEIHKLLAYVNYRRAVEPDDVQHLTSDSSQGDIFAMVDAMSAQDGRKALQVLHKLLEEGDAREIFPMVVRQFRLMIKAREILDEFGPGVNFTQLMGEKYSFVADKAVRQASQFSLPVLEAVYRRLLEIDEALKTSQMEGDIALDTLVASFTSQKQN